MSRENAYISYPAFVTSSTPARPNLALLGVTVALIEAAALAGCALAYAVGLGTHAAASRSRTLASIALFLVGAMLLLAIARGFRRGQTWERSASLVFNALLVPVSLTVITGNGPFVGIPVLALAIVGIVAALLMNGVDDAA